MSDQTSTPQTLSSLSTGGLVARLRETVANCRNPEPKQLATGFWTDLADEIEEAADALARDSDALKALLDCLHHANPTDDSQWHVKPGSHNAFSQAVWRLSSQGSRSDDAN